MFLSNDTDNQLSRRVQVRRAEPDRTRHDLIPRLYDTLTSAFRYQEAYAARSETQLVKAVSGVRQKIRKVEADWLVRNGQGG